MKNHNYAIRNCEYFIENEQRQQDQTKIYISSTEYHFLIMIYRTRRKKEKRIIMMMT